MKATKVDYKAFDRAKLGNLTQKDLKQELKTNGHDKLKFLVGALQNPVHRKAILSRYSSYLSRAPLKALSLESSFTSVPEEKINKFLKEILHSQKSSLETLEILDTLKLTSETSRKMNQWMKSKQIITFSLRHSLTSAEDLKTIFEVKEGDKDIQVKELNLEFVNLHEGCLRNLSHIIRLSLADISLDKLAWDELCVLVKKSHTIKVLILYNVVESIARAKLLGDSVAENKTIKRLDLLKEDTDVAGTMMEVLFQNETLSIFNFRPTAYPCNLNPILTALRDALPNAKAPLTSLNFGRLKIPNDILALVSSKIVLSRRGNAWFDRVVDELNRGTVIENTAIKTMLIGSASDILSEEILKQPMIDPGFQASLPVGNDPVVLLQLDVEPENEHKLVVGIGSSDQAHARLLIRSVEQELAQKAQVERDESESQENQNTVANKAIKPSDLLSYCARTGYVNGDMNSLNSLRVNNMWLGVKLEDMEVPFVQKTHEVGGVYLASFLVSRMLSFNFCEEMRKLSSLLHKVPDTVDVIFVGVIDESISGESLESFNFEIESLKRFISNKLWKVLPQKFREKLGSKHQVDNVASKVPEDYIVFLDFPFAQSNARDFNAFWRAVDVSVTSSFSEVDPRWYIVLNLLKTRGTPPYTYTTFADVAKEARTCGVRDVSDMVNFFEESGELVVLPAETKEYEGNSLVVLDKLWLKAKLELITSERMVSKAALKSGVWDVIYAESLWQDEEKWVSDILTKHAENLGLLIKLKERGGWLLPYATAPDSCSAGRHYHYNSSQPLFWIEIPHHYRKFEVFSLFSARLLNNLLVDKQEEVDEQLFWRNSSSMGYALLQTDDYAWARCDTKANRILIGMPEQLFDVFGSFLDQVKQALQDTIEFLTSNNEELPASNVEIDDQKLKRYPHLIFRTVGENNEVIEQPYLNFETANPPKELYAAVDHTMLTDVAIISFSRTPYVGFIASVLQLEGLSVDYKEKFAAQENYRYRLLVVLLGNDEKEKANSVLEGRKDKFLVRSMKQSNFDSYKEEFKGCKSLENFEKPEAGLNELTMDVMKELGYQ